MRTSTIGSRTSPGRVSQNVSLATMACPWPDTSISWMHITYVVRRRKEAEPANALISALSASSKVGQSFHAFKNAGSCKFRVRRKIERLYRATLGTHHRDSSLPHGRHRVFQRLGKHALQHIVVDAF